MNGGLRALFTGASSPLGARVLRCLLDDDRYAEVWCAVHHQHVDVQHPKVRLLPLSLDDDVALPEAFDTVIHFAGVTHARDPRRYWDVNHRGTMKLAHAARERGCRRFFYVSTRCATEGSGAYGESKLAAENELRQLEWDALTIVRPAEVYGGGGREGIDRFIAMAKRFHIVPLLWGHKGLRFAPINVDDFVNRMCALLRDETWRTGNLACPDRQDCLSSTNSRVHIVELSGPETLTGAQLAMRIAREHRALPLPLWWPALALLLRTIPGVVAPDQLARLTGPKTS